jgi:hypothetical protein
MESDRLAVDFIGLFFVFSLPDGTPHVLPQCEEKLSCSVSSFFYWLSNISKFGTEYLP